MEASIETRLEQDGSVRSFVRERRLMKRHDLSGKDGDLGEEPSFPTTLALCGLGACTVMTLRLFAVSTGLDLGAISVLVTTVNHRDGQRICRRVTFQRKVFKSDRMRLAAVCERTPWTLLLKKQMSLQTEILQVTEGPSRWRRK